MCNYPANNIAFSYEIKHPVLVTGCFLYIFVQMLTAG
nr:MAG TPA: hypothetical protein [Caudoviricetes sp.]